MTAVAERPVTKTFVAVAGFFAVRRVGVVRVGMALSAVLSEDRGGADSGGDDGRSGSFSISHHPHRGDRRHDGLRCDFHPHHGRHRLYGSDEPELAESMGV